MNIVKFTLLSLLLLTGPIVRAEPAAVSTPHAVDPLAEALPILEAKYVDFKALDYKPGDHLGDLVARSGGKISLEAPVTDSVPMPIVTALLPDKVIYWRLASFTPEKGWTDLAAQLERERGSAEGIILDVRSNVAPDDYAGASEIRSFFQPQTITIAPRTDMKLDEEPIAQLFPFPTIVLTNNQTTGAAEALAGFLQADGALVVGRATAGRVAYYEKYKLSNGQVLRYVTARPGTNNPACLFKFRTEMPSWGQPVTPDIAPTVDDYAEKGALVLIRDNHILDVIQESPKRHLMSEASLVRGQDPEWDDYLASLERRPVLLSLPVIHDVVLIRALDSLKAIRLSERAPPAQVTANASQPASSSVQ